MVIKGFEDVKHGGMPEKDARKGYTGGWTYDGIDTLIVLQIFLKLMNSKFLQCVIRSKPVFATAGPYARVRRGAPLFHRHVILTYTLSG